MAAYMASCEKSSSAGRISLSSARRASGSPFLKTFSRAAESYGNSSVKKKRTIEGKLSMFAAFGWHRAKTFAMYSPSEPTSMSDSDFIAALASSANFSGGRARMCSVLKCAILRSSKRALLFTIPGKSNSSTISEMSIISLSFLGFQPSRQR